ncbi:CPBP family glutamic-type intramembrane protease [Streptomyces sp. NPDC054866]
MIFLPLPSFSPAWWALLAGFLVGATGVALEWKEVNRWLQPTYLRLFPSITPLDRSRDILHFAFCGAAQEYLYRYVVIFAVAPVMGPIAILLSAALFVGEHMVQRSAGAWDRRDLVIHAGMGLALGGLAYGNGLLPALIGHTVYNAPNLLVSARRPGTSHAASLTTSK